MSVDRDDNDPSRLWRHVPTGVRHANPNVRDGVPAHLAATSRMPAASLVRLLINSIDRISAPLVVAFDDVHELTDRQPSRDWSTSFSTLRRS